MKILLQNNTQHETMSRILTTGAPHFHSLMKQFRQANYTLPKVVNEFVDNAIKKTSMVEIASQVDDRLQELCISDNIETGFENMEKVGIENPFNMGHIKIAHEDDSETSEFGVGMKAGALSAANQLNVYSRVIGVDGTYKYIEVICDFIRMAGEEDVNASYNPRIREISYAEYRDVHPFECGSTIKLSKIRDAIYPKTTQHDITAYICKELSKTYSRFISRGVVMKVNGEEVAPLYDYFADPKCVPFIVKRDIFILENNNGRRYIACNSNEEDLTWYEYDSKDKKSPWKKSKDLNHKEIENLIKNDGYKYVYTPINSYGHCLTLRTTFTFYSDRLFALHKSSHEDEHLEIPEDVTYIYKDNRSYGNKSLFKHNDGCHNYTLNDMDFISKKLGKDIGITFNKEICMEGNNEIIHVIRSMFQDTRRGISANRSTTPYRNAYNKAIRCGILSHPVDSVYLPTEKKPQTVANETPAIVADSTTNQMHSASVVTSPLLLENHPIPTSPPSQSQLVSAFFQLNHDPDRNPSSPSTVEEEQTNTSDISEDEPEDPTTQPTEEEPTNQTIVEEQPTSHTVVKEEPVHSTMEESANEIAVEEEPMNQTTVEEDPANQTTVEEDPANQTTAEDQHVLQVSESDIEYESRIKRMISIIVYLQKSVAEENALSNDVITAIEHALPNIEYK